MFAVYNVKITFCIISNGIISSPLGAWLIKSSGLAVIHIQLGNAEITVQSRVLITGFIVFRNDNAIHLSQPLESDHLFCFQIQRASCVNTVSSKTSLAEKSKSSRKSILILDSDDWRLESQAFLCLSLCFH